MELQPLVVLSGAGSRRPIFCMHPIGGHVGEYIWLAERIDRDQPIFAIGSRGRRDAQLEHPSLEAAAADYATIVAGHAEAPYRLAGWSMGGLIAHAVACELERRGAAVELVAMVDPPSRMPPAGADDLRIAVTMAIQIFHPSPPPRPIVRRELAQLAADHEIAGIASWCTSRGLAPADVPTDEFEAAVRLFPKHRELVERHVPGICHAPLRIWKAREAVPGSGRDWAAHTMGTCTVKSIAADHFTIMRPPHVDAIAADLSALG